MADHAPRTCGSLLVSARALERIRAILVSGGDVTRRQVGELTAAFREGAGAPAPPVSAPGPTPSP